MTAPGTARPDSTRPGATADDLLARRRAIVDWCDRHLAAMHKLSALLVDDPSVVQAALSELLGDPADPADRRSARSDRSGPSDRTNPSGRTDPSGRTTAPHRLSATRADRPLTRPDLCPDGTRPTDRVELALRLMGDRTSAMAAKALHLPEHTVTLRLHTGLWVLFSACEGADGDR